LILLTITIVFSGVRAEKSNEVEIPWKYELEQFTLEIEHNGWGPYYSISLSGNGKVNFRGSTNTHDSKEIHHSKSVSAEKVKAILELIYKSNYFYYPSQYDTYIVKIKESTVISGTSFVSDADTPSIKIVMGTFSKEFMVTKSAPIEAKYLIPKIESILEIEKWLALIKLTKN